MKQLILLLLIISITTISWASYAKNSQPYVNAVSNKSSIVIKTFALKPSLSNQLIDESFNFGSNKANNKHNSFFEFAIVFNEKLQQFIAFFSQSTEKAKEIISNISSSTTTTFYPVNEAQLSAQKCKENN